MAMLTVRNLSDEVHRPLRARAAQHGQSMEAEVREILQSAINPKGRVKLGSLLADMGRQVRLSDEEFAVFAQLRDNSPARLVSNGSDGAARDNSLFEAAGVMVSDPSQS